MYISKIRRCVGGTSSVPAFVSGSAYNCHKIMRQARYLRVTPKSVCEDDLSVGRKKKELSLKLVFIISLVVIVIDIPC